MMNGASRIDLRATLERLHFFGEGHNGAAVLLPLFIMNCRAEATRRHGESGFFSDGIPDSFARFFHSCINGGVRFHFRRRSRLAVQLRLRHHAKTRLCIILPQQRDTVDDDIGVLALPREPLLH